VNLRFGAGSNPLYRVQQINHDGSLDVSQSPLIFMTMAWALIQDEIAYSRGGNGNLGV
jgi:hypothetical protein